MARSGEWADWAVSFVNGLYGDRLSRRGNGLAQEMAFYHAGRPLALTPTALAAAHPHPTGKLCVLVHGLSCHEGVWSYHDPDHPVRAVTYGTLLQADLGYTPFAVRYNTGLALAQNSRSLALLLDALAAAYPREIEEIVLIGHSMGGLLFAGAATHSAQGGAATHSAQEGAGWVGRVRRAVYLGTPHDGADLAALTHTAAAVLHAVPTVATRLVGDYLDLRSQGVKDLRLGGRADPHAAPLPGAPGSAARPHALAHARHHLAVGTLAESPGHLASVLLGDGLVRAPHAGAGQYDVAHFPRTHHMQLPRNPAVYRQIRRWCGESL